MAKKNELLLYGPVGGGFWIDGFTDQDVNEWLADCDGDITVRINSGGGDVFQGVAIFNSLKMYDRGKVTMRVDGIAASAASVILMAGEERIMGEGSTVMIHNASSFTFGNAEDHQKQINALQKIDISMSRIYAKRAGMSEDEAKAFMKEETWFTAAEAVAEGLATKSEAEDEDLANDEARASASLFDYRVYAKAPERYLAMAREYAAKHPTKTAQAVRRQNKPSGSDTASAPSGENEMSAFDIKSLTASALKEQRPDLVKEITDSIDIAAAKKSAFEEGVAAENKRIADIEEIAVPGHKALLAQYKGDKSKTAADFAIAMAKANKAAITAAAKDQDEEDTKTDGLGDAPRQTKQKETVAAVGEGLEGNEKYEAQWKAMTADQREEYSSKEAFFAYQRMDEKGRVRVFKGGKAA